MCWQIFRQLLRPTPDWGPALSKFRTGRYAVENDHENNGAVWTSGIGLTGPQSSRSTEAVFEDRQNGVNVLSAAWPKT